MKYTYILLGKILILAIIYFFMNCNRSSKDSFVCQFNNIDFCIKFCRHGDNGRVFFSRNQNFGVDYLDYVNKGNYLEIIYDALNHNIYAFDRDTAVNDIKQKEFCIKKVNLIHKDSIRLYSIDGVTYKYPSFGEWSDSTAFHHPHYDIHIYFSNNSHSIEIYDSIGYIFNNWHFVEN